MIVLLSSFYKYIIFLTLPQKKDKSINEPDLISQYTFFFLYCTWQNVLSKVVPSFFMTCAKRKWKKVFFSLPLSLEIRPLIHLDLQIAFKYSSTSKFAIYYSKKCAKKIKTDFLYQEYILQFITHSSISMNYFTISIWVMHVFSFSSRNVPME